MPTEIRAINDVDYALDITVSADELQPQIVAALKKEGARMNLKGFRPGKVPLGMVRKMVGPQVAVQVAEQQIGKAYEAAVVTPEELDVIGQPRLIELDFDAESKEADLKAVVQFGVRPEFELASATGMPVTRVVRAFTDEDIDADIQRRRDLAATEEEAEEGATLTDTDIALVDIQPVDAEGEPSGPVQHEARIILANPDLRPELRDALLGQPVGETVNVEFPHDHAEDEETDHDDHVDRYRVTVQTVLNRIVPELDDAFIQKETGNEEATLDDLKEQIREELQRSWDQRARQSMESKMVEQFVNAHRDIVQVPETIIDTALDSQLEEIQQRNGGQLPPTFDTEAFREQNREAAADQVRWLFVKDKLVSEEGLEVSPEDMDAEFAKMAGEDGDLEMIKGYFTQQPQLLQQMGDQILNQRVFEKLESRFEIIEKSREDIEKEAAERKAAQPVELTPDLEED